MEYCFSCVAKQRKRFRNVGVSINKINLSKSFLSLTTEKPTETLDTKMEFFYNDTEETMQYVERKNEECKENF